MAAHINGGERFTILRSPQTLFYHIYLYRSTVYSTLRPQLNVRA